MGRGRHSSVSGAGGRDGGPGVVGRVMKNPIHWMLLLLPVAIVLDRAQGVQASVTFFVAALAMLPLAKMLVDATEEISVRIGPAAGGLLNATFGNAPEMIIALVALRAGQIDLVKASIVGAILGNLLFVTGLSFVVGSLRHHLQDYNPRGARIQASMLMVATISLIVPSLFHFLITPEAAVLERSLNTAVAVLLLVVYSLSLLFTLRTHPEYFAPIRKAHREVHTLRWSVPTAATVLVASSVALAIVSEILVRNIEPTAEAFGMSKVFVGVVVMALLGGAGESVAAVTMAAKNKIDLTMSITMGSSIQIAAFVAPALVLLSYVIAPQPMDLVVGYGGVLIILLAVLIMAMTAGDGQSNWFKGVQLLASYILFAAFCYFLPDSLTAASVAP